MHALNEIFTHAVMITAFVAVMMVVIEYLNVRTRGVWEVKLQKNPSWQYVMAALLGVIPGCLGSFTVIAMHLHGSVTAGAVVAAMIATSGDAAFFMMAEMPEVSLLVFVVLAVTGIVSGFLTDRFFGKYLNKLPAACDQFVVHKEAHCGSLSVNQICQVWRKCSIIRLILSLILLVSFAAFLLGWIAAEEEVWIRFSLAAVILVALAIVGTVPDHFLEEHLWKHVLLKHVPVLAAWMVAAIFVMHLFVEHVGFMGIEENSRWVVLLLACLIGLIPDSGPHLIFITLFSGGMIPFSVLLANSMVQDGHGMLPLLAHSRKSFCVIKIINFAVGFSIGVLLMLIGY